VLREGLLPASHAGVAMRRVTIFCPSPLGTDGGERVRFVRALQVPGEAAAPVPFDHARRAAGG